MKLKLIILLNTFLVFLFFFFSTFNSNVLAATNYGECDYGGGTYNDGGCTTTTSTSGSSNSSSSPSAPSCGDSVTKGTPNLFEIRTTKNTATLYFAPPPMPYSNFYIAFSRKTDSWEYGVQFDQGKSGGVLKYTINQLSPKTKYYFSVRPGNGCMAGNWGNTMTATTTSSTTQRTYYKNVIAAVVGQISSFVKFLLPNTGFAPQNVTSPAPQPTIQAQIPITNPPPPKAKFCILWWCF